MNFMNSSTWYLSILDKNKKEVILSINDYKLIKDLMDKTLTKLNLDNYSPIERVGIIYDFCKKIEIDDNVNEMSLILKTKKASKEKLILLFQLLLREINIDSYIGEVINDGVSSEVLIADIVDKKYDINGVYLFDVLSDYLTLDEVPSDSLNKINYNYFAIRLGDYSKTIFNDRLFGILNCLQHDLEYDYEKLISISKHEIKYLELSLNNDFESLHERISSSKEIDDNDKLRIIDAINNDELKDVINENYLSRKDKILNYGIIN